MSFRFNFQIEDGVPSTSLGNVDKTVTENKYVAEAKEIYVEDKHKELLRRKDSSMNLKIGDVSFKIISPNFLEKELKLPESARNVIRKAIELHTDLIEGEYEGGLKIWEGAIDLCNYLSRIKLSLSDKKILEIGCGSGLPGLYAYKQNAVVHFQDYNEEVLNYCTIPNILMNSEDELSVKIPKCRFFSGDWDGVLGELTKQWNINLDRYDFIFTSETIYNPVNHSKLLRLMKNVLKENGEIYLSAKTYYFGVGGNIEQFKQLVYKDNYFDIEQCWSNEEGVKREIIKLKKRIEDKS